MLRWAGGWWDSRLQTGSIVGRQRIDDLRNFGDFRNRDAAQLGMFADRILALGKIDAKGLVARDVAVLPLDRRSDRAQRLVGCPGRAAQFGHGKTPDAGNVALDHVSLETGHSGLLRLMT